MEGANGPAAVSLGVLWATATWLDQGVVSAALALALAIGLLAQRYSLAAVPLRGMAAAAAVGAMAHLLGGGSPGSEAPAAASAALRLAALLVEGRFLYLRWGPSALAAGVAWLSRPLAILGVRPEEMRLMALVVLRLLPEARRVGHRVLLGRRYLGLRPGVREIGRVAGAWIGGILETASAIAESLVLRGFSASRPQAVEHLSWRALLSFGWLPAVTMLFALAGGVR